MNKRINVRFLVFLVEAAYPRYNANCFIIYMFLNYCDVLKQRQIFTLHAVSSTFVNNFVGENMIWDVDNTVIVNSNIQRTSIQFVVVKMSNAIIKRKVHVVEKPFDNNYVALVSYNLLYNLNNATDCTFRKCHSSNFKFADEVELCLINSSNDWNHAIVDICLKNYFKKPKILYAGDILRVSLATYGKEIFYGSTKLHRISQELYFKCNKVIYQDKHVNGGYLCATDKSNLKQSTNMQSFVPKNLHPTNARFNCTPQCPDGLDSYFQSIMKGVYPFIINKNHQRFSPIFLLEGPKGSGKSLLIKCVAADLGMHLISINNFEISANVYAQNETKLKNTFFGAKIIAPSILEIKNFENFGKNNEGEYDERLISYFTNEVKNLFVGNTFPVILFCSTNETNLPIELKRVFLKSFEIKGPTNLEREKILTWILKTTGVKSNCNVSNIANISHGFLFEDLKALSHYAVTGFNEQMYRDEPVPDGNFLLALDFMQSNYNESLGAPKVPQVKWEDIGGLNDVKEEIIKTIKLPLKHPNILKNGGLKRTGILLFGPPGTGKTLIAKAVATECGLCFLSVKGPELLNMYVGQSEYNVRKVFERARNASPCIIFFDELDSLAPNRGASGDSGGVMDRVVSQLLAEMDGLNQSGTIFIIGATNRPDLIDPALLRPGRIDKLVYVGPCIDRDSKIAVLKALTRKFQLDDPALVEKFVDMCPENFSGADFYGICSNAWMSAVRRLITNIENGEGKVENHLSNKDVTVSLEDFKIAIKNVKPSIKKEDMEYFHKMKSNMY